MALHHGEMGDRGNNASLLWEVVRRQEALHWSYSHVSNRVRQIDTVAWAGLRRGPRAGGIGEGGRGHASNFKATAALGKRLYDPTVP